jgi:hypothetical protein
LTPTSLIVMPGARLKPATAGCAARLGEMINITNDRIRAFTA